MPIVTLWIKESSSHLTASKILHNLERVLGTTVTKEAYRGVRAWGQGWNRLYVLVHWGAFQSLADVTTIHPARELAGRRRRAPLTIYYKVYAFVLPNGRNYYEQLVQRDIESTPPQTFSIKPGLWLRREPKRRTFSPPHPQDRNQTQHRIPVQVMAAIHPLFQRSIARSQNSPQNNVIHLFRQTFMWWGKQGDL